MTNSMVATAGESELSTISTGFLSLSFSISISKQPTKPSESQGEDKFLGSSTWIIWVLNYIKFLSLLFSTNISRQPTKPSESQGEDKFLGS